MAFCKYCGSQIEDGQQCNCEGAQAARAAAANPQPQVQSVQADQVKAVASNVGAEMVDVLKKFFTSPVELFGKVYASTSQVAQYVFLGIYAIVAFLFFGLLFEGVDSPFLVGLALAVALVAIKAVFAFAAFLVKDTEGSFNNAFGLFSATTIAGTIAIILVFIFSKMSFVVGAFTVLLVWIVVDAVYSFLAFRTVIKNSVVKAMNVFFIATTIITLVCVAIGYNKIMDLVEEMFSNALSSLW
ncbi:MAG: hypothetical protein K6F66_01220 [Pseudobutyrivibrio sp.]|nr:hypothetical protein [Pseudobutyrivibrio sp.]